MPSLEELTKDDFAARLGETFEAAAQERALSLTLRKVDSLPQPPGDDGRAPFSLEFTEAAQDHVPQQTVEFHDPANGTYPMFVVPLGPGEDGMRYEAIFT